MASSVYYPNIREDRQTDSHKGFTEFSRPLTQFLSTTDPINTVVMYGHL